ncbi:hypothetical protein GCM10009560_19140 [Nonomuraea longicatena]|uniref:Subtilisin inhibitor domain-containing protein n=2 Tax=Nonomuraea longicatena TaxID=83682 RepID=A0ABP3ZIZ0_9ACTN
MRLMCLAAFSCIAITAGPAAHASAAPPQNGFVLGNAGRHVLLVCDGKPSAHPRAAEVCASLERTKGDLSRLTTSLVYCTKEFAPVAVHAMGVWEGRLVRYTATFGNVCELRAETGALFDF